MSEDVIDDDAPITRTILRKEFEQWRELRKLEEEAKSGESSNKLDALINDLEKSKRFTKLKRWVIGILTAGGTLTFGGYKLVLQPAQEAEKVQPEDVQATVTKESTQLEHRVTANSKKVERLAEIAVEQQELTVKTADYIGQKIDAAHPKTADVVPKPKALDDAEEAVQERKRKARAGELFKDIDAALEAETGG